MNTESTANVNIPTQNNIKEIVTAITSNINLTKTVVSSAIGAVTAVGNKAEDASKTVTTLSKLEKTINTYSNVVKTVIDILTKDFPEGKTMADMLGYVYRTEADGNDATLTKKVEKFTVIEAALQIPNIINGMISSLQKLSEFKTGIRMLIRIKLNIKLLKIMIKDVMMDLLTMFKGLVNKEDIQELVDSLVKQPDTVAEYVKSSHEQTAEFKIKDFTDTKKITRQGKLGLLDVFTQTFSIINSLNGIKVPGFISLEIKMLKVRIALKRVLQHLTKFVKKNVTNKTFEDIFKFTELITGDGENGNKIGIVKLFQKLAMLPAILERVKLNKKVFKGFNALMSFTETVITQIKQLIDSNDAQFITDKNNEKNIKNLVGVFESFSNLANSIANMGIKGRIVKFFKKSILALIGTISEVVQKIESTFKERKLSEETIESIDDINKIINSLTGLSYKIILFALLSPIAMAALIVNLIFISGLLLFVSAVGWLCNLFPNRVIREINKDITRMGSIFLTLMLIGASILTLALFAPVIIKAIWQTTILVGALLVFMILIAGTFWVVSKILNNVLADVLKTLGVILLMTGLMLIVGTVLLVLALIAEKLNEMRAFLKITALVGGIILFVGVMVGLGLLLAIPYVMAGIGAATGSMGLILALVLIVLGIATALIKLSSIDINKLGVKQLSNGEFVIEKTKGTAIYNAQLVIETAKHLLTLLNGDISTKEGKKQARRSKKTLKQVDKCVKEIVEIAERLSYLQNVKIDEGLITDSVKSIFVCVNRVNEKLESFNTSAAGKHEDYKDAQRKTKKRMRRNKKVLKKVDKVINEIVDIAEGLITIKDFKITSEEEQLINGGIENIFKCIDKVNLKINELNGAVVKNDTTGEIESLASKRKQRRLARKQKRVFKKQAKQMSKMESILTNIADIVDALESIKDFKWDEKESGNISDKVGLILKPLEDISAKIENENIKAPKNNVIEGIESLITIIQDIIDESDKINKLELTSLTSNNDLIITTITDFSTKINNVNSVKFEKLQNYDNVIKPYISGLINVSKKLNKLSLNKLENNLNLIYNAITKITTTEISNISTDSITNLDNLLTYINKLKSLSGGFKIIGVATITNIVDEVNKVVTSINSSKFDNLSSNTDLIIKNIKKITGIVNGEGAITNKQLNGLQKLINYTYKLNKEISSISSVNQQGLEKNIGNYIKFVDKVNTMDVKKLETSAKMFEQMSKFSTSIRGDFDRLAEALNENLMPVLEELKEIMEKIPEKLDDGFQNTSASIAATNAPATRENVEAQARRENPNMTPEEVKRVVDSRLAEKSKSESTGVAAKLDELINLLKGYGSDNVVVQTI